MTKEARAKKKADTLRWVKEYGAIVTPAWSAYCAAKAGISWQEYLEANPRFANLKKTG